MKLLCHLQWHLIIIKDLLYNKYICKLLNLAFIYLIKDFCNYFRLISKNQASIVVIPNN